MARKASRKDDRDAAAKAAPGAAGDGQAEVDVVVPEMGESVVDATLSRWLASTGDRVSAGQAVAELETDKVDLEVAAPADGVLGDRRVAEGTDVKAGEVIATVRPGPPSAGDAAPRTDAPEAAAEGDRGAERDQGGDGDGPAPDEPAPTAPAPNAPAPDAPAATPVARRVADATGVDLSAVRGTGARERITRRDVEAHAAGGAAAGPPGSATAAAAPGDAGAAAASPGKRSADAWPSSASPGTRPEERVRLSRRRRTIAARLLEAQSSAAMLTTFNDVDMSAVMDLRARHKEGYRERHGVGLGITSFFVKAAVGALRAFPRLNSELDGDELVLKGYVDVGVAVDDAEGLVVPVVRDADRLSLLGIDRAVAELARRTREGALTVDDLRGGTFTVTNGGVFGSLLSTPILNTPQVGILGLHRIEPRPVARDGQVVVRAMMYVALTYDHRVVDGREAVGFLAHVKGLVEDPERLLIEA